MMVAVIDETDRRTAHQMIGSASLGAVSIATVLVQRLNLRHVHIMIRGACVQALAYATPPRAVCIVQVQATILSISRTDSTVIVSLLLAPPSFDQ
jgi:hypothetical protein